MGLAASPLLVGQRRRAGGKVAVIPFELEDFGEVGAGEEEHPHHYDDGRIDGRRTALRLREVPRLRLGLVDLPRQADRLGFDRRHAEATDLFGRQEAVARPLGGTSSPWRRG